MTGVQTCALPISRTLSDPFGNLDHPNCILIQYFRPTSRERNVQEHYTSWDSAKGLHWKVDTTRIWVFCDCKIWLQWVTKSENMTRRWYHCRWAECDWDESCWVIHFQSYHWWVIFAVIWIWEYKKPFLAVFCQHGVYVDFPWRLDIFMSCSGKIKKSYVECDSA